MPPKHFSNDPLEIEAFLADLPPATKYNNYADTFLIVLLTWKDVDPEFLIRLFEKTHLFQSRDNIIPMFFEGARINLIPFED